MTNSNLPLISVVMPVYNAERFVGSAVESILLQTYSHLELIVVDDGSEDRSRKVVEALAGRDARVRPLSVEHGGTSVALNAGIAAARGNYIALMDADDLALAERLAVQLDYMRRTGADVCGACIQCFGSKSKVLWFPESHAAIRSELLFRCALLPSTVLMRAAVLKSNAYLPGLVLQDYEMWTRLATRYHLANCQQVLARYRRHPQQITQLSKTQADGEMRRYRRRHFLALFPEARPEDADGFERLALERAHPTLADLKAAAVCLLRAGDVPDAFLKKRMAERWLGACSRSAGLGMACLDLYHRVALELGGADPRAIRRLRLRCLLRLSTGSRADQHIKQLLSANRDQDHATA